MSRLSLVWLFLIVVAGMVIGNILGLIFVLPALNFDFVLLQKALGDIANYPQIRIPMILMQGVTSLFAFILAPWFFIKVIAKNNFDMNISKLDALNIISPILLVLVSIPFVSFLNEFNHNINFPDFLSGFEQWAVSKEKTLKSLTSFMMDLNGIGELMLAILVLAVLPGIGEEYLFRGIMQKYLQKSNWNIHVAIWVSAIVFSAIHMQFLGFIPRMFLGALLGYLYFWSGNILVPVIGHITNNAAGVLLVYLSKNGLIGFDAESDASLSWYITAASLVGIIVFMFYNMKIFTKNNENTLKPSV